MNKKIFFLSIVLFSSFFAIGQTVDSVYTSASQMPEFVGGEEALFRFLAKHIEYPREAKENDITGEVYAVFIVNKDGSISDTKIAKDIGGGCGAAVLKVINKMPNWEPAMNNGKVVRVEYTLPISFQSGDAEGPYDKLSKKEQRLMRKKNRKLNRQSR